MNRGWTQLEEVSGDPMSSDLLLPDSDSLVSALSSRLCHLIMSPHIDPPSALIPAFGDVPDTGVARSRIASGVEYTGCTIVALTQTPALKKNLCI